MLKRKCDTLAGPSSPAFTLSASNTRKPDTDIIEAANALSYSDFLQRIKQAETSPHGKGIHLEYKDGRSHIDPFFSTNLPQDDLHRCFALVESTSRHDYEPSSFGWHPKRKLREMKEKEMRYLMLRSTSGGFQGFLSFMLTYDSVPAVPVVYVYEIHLTEDARGRGLARHLMDVVEMIAKEFRVSKVMLTCFKSNSNAWNFYKYLGYVKDVSSPDDRKTRKKVVKTDYVILSKEMLPVAGAIGQTTIGDNEEAQVNTPPPSKVDEQANRGSSLDEHVLPLRHWAQAVASDFDGTYAAVISNGPTAVGHLRNHNFSDGVAAARALATAISRYELNLHVTRLYYEAIWEKSIALRKHMDTVRSFARLIGTKLPDDVKECYLGDENDVYGKMRRELDEYHSSLLSMLDQGESGNSIHQSERIQKPEILACESRLERRGQMLDAREDQLRQRETLLKQREDAHERGRQILEERWREYRACARPHFAQVKDDRLDLRAREQAAEAGWESTDGSEGASDDCSSDELEDSELEHDSHDQDDDDYDNDLPPSLLRFEAMWLS